MNFFIIASSVFSLLSSGASAQQPLLINQLSPEALDCVHQVVNTPDIFENSKNNGGSSATIDAMAVSMCTYSNAHGAMTCYRQAKQDENIFKTSKLYINTIAIEKDYLRLCSNSKLKMDQEVEAINCYKSIIRNPDLLPILKTGSALELEKKITDLCISSNAKGATLCLENVKANPDKIFPISSMYWSPKNKEIQSIQICRNSRLPTTDADKNKYYLVDTDSTHSLQTLNPKIEEEVDNSEIINSEEE